jgi:hypothetical protein
VSAPGAPDVLVMDARLELEVPLGPAQSAALAEELRAQAASFARSVAGGPFHTAKPPEGLSDAVMRVFGVGRGHEDGAPGSGPVLVIWPELARIGDTVGGAALEDIRSGADVVLGPVLDGGLYLLGLRQPFPELLERLEESLASREPATASLAVASEMGLEIGLLRVERALRTASDVEAALADPLTPEEIRRVLSGSDQPNAPK